MQPSHGEFSKLFFHLLCRFLHKDTNGYLANHNVQYQRPIPGHTEVHALKSKGGSTTWKAGEGVYFAGEQN